MTWVMSLLCLGVHVLTETSFFFKLLTMGGLATSLYCVGTLNETIFGDIRIDRPLQLASEVKSSDI